MEIIDFCRREAVLIRQHPWEFLTAAVLAGGLGFGMADYHYAGRNAELLETLQTKEFPKPVVQTVTVKVPDPAQTQIIQDLQTKLTLLETLRARPLPAAPKVSSGNISAGNGNIIAPNMSGGSNTIVNPKPVPRHLSEEAKQNLLRIFKPLASTFPTLIIDAPGDGEAQDYAKEFMGIFNKAGIGVSGVGLTFSRGGGTGNADPYITVKNSDHVPPLAEKFAEAMDSAGIKVQLGTMDILGPDDFRLVVPINQ